MVEYYSDFCVDRLGIPVAVDMTKGFTADYRPPVYPQVYLSPLWTGAVAEEKK